MMDSRDPVLISAIEHYSYCPRQCALIHLEQSFDENLYTLRGRAVHEGVDEPSIYVREDVRYERALPIWSAGLGLVGKADLVEFHDGVPYPVEYKSGRHRKGTHEALQLCAQAMCLEEMFGVTVDRGAIYWHASRQRQELCFVPEVREEVEEIAVKVHEMLAERKMPPPVNDKRCRRCSLKDSCLPEITGEGKKVLRVTNTLFVPNDE